MTEGFLPYLTSSVNSSQVESAQVAQRCTCDRGDHGIANAASVDVSISYGVRYMARPRFTRIPATIIWDGKHTDVWGCAVLKLSSSYWEARGAQP